MKKLILGLFILLAILLSPNASAAVWSYEWYNTEIEVQVGDSIYNYNELPYAKLYRDGILLEDAQINIIDKGDWLYYLTDVKTNKVGTYYVWYKAFENSKYIPGTCHNYKCLVTFKVVDKISPNITGLIDNIRIKKGSEYSLSDYFEITDNYDKELRVEYYESIDISKAGHYECSIVAVDSSGNSSSHFFVVEVYDDVAPAIEYLGEQTGIEVMLGSTPNLCGFFRAKDESDGDISSRIEYPDIDTSIIGERVYEFRVSDLSGNYTSVFVNVSVVDNMVPKISLYTNILTLDYYDDIGFYDFYRYIEYLEDNGQRLSIDQVTIRHDIVKKVGQYHIYYSFSDGENETIESIAVNVISSVSPTILVNDITVKENERIDFSQYIEVYDDSDENVALSLIINDDNVDYTKKGKYLATAYAINSSGLSTTKSFYITVVNDDKLMSFFESEEVIYLLASVAVLAIGVFILFRIKRNKRV